MIVVASERWGSRLEEAFEEVKIIQYTRCEHCLASIQRRPIYVCRGWKQSLSELWPRPKRFI